MLLVALTPPGYAADMSRFEKRMLTITILVSCALAAALAWIVVYAPPPA